MPRRKRKLTPSKKGQLRFVESPLSIFHGIPSPVFASDNPCTADVIAIDKSASIPWVSPQFVGRPSTVRLTRARKRQLQDKEKLKSNIHDDNTVLSNTSGNAIKNKKVPLRFKGDRSPTPPSPIQELTFREDSTQNSSFKDASQSNNKVCKTPIKLRPKRSIKSGSVSDFIAADDNTSFSRTNVMHVQNQARVKRDYKLLDKVGGIESTGAYKRLMKHQQQIDDELSTSFTEIKSNRRKRKTKMAMFNDTDSDITLLEDQHSCEAIDDIKNKSELPICTQTIAVHSGKKKMFSKRLFSQSVQHSLSTSMDNSNNQDKSIAEESNMNRSCNLNNITTPDIREVVRHLVPPLSANNAKSSDLTPLGESNQGNNKINKIPKQISQQRSNKFLSNTPERQFKQKYILVYDTPEEDYGMRARQRQTKYWRP